MIAGGDFFAQGAQVVEKLWGSGFFFLFGLGHSLIDFFLPFEYGVGTGLKRQYRILAFGHC